MRVGKLTIPQTDILFSLSFLASYLTLSSIKGSIFQSQALPRFCITDEFRLQTSLCSLGWRFPLI